MYGGIEKSVHHSLIHDTSGHYPLEPLWVIANTKAHKHIWMITQVL